MIFMRKGLFRGLLPFLLACLSMSCKAQGTPSETVPTTPVDTPVGRLFRQFTFHDAKTGVTLPYNLYVPHTLEAGKTYPLVLFMHDLSGVGKEVTYTLTQGNGATVWASPEWQANHPCLVLAPEFGRQIVGENNMVTSVVDACLHLVDSVVAAYPVDRDRVYTTGQSMGCIAPVKLSADAETNRRALDSVLAAKPMAVELDYADTTDVSRAIRQVKASSKVCFNIAGKGLNADYDASAALDHEQTPGLDKLIEARGADVIITSELKHVMLHIQGLDAGANAPTVVSGSDDMKWYHPVDSIDFSPRHRTLIYGPDSTYRPMDVPWFQSELVAPGTWHILSDGDYCYLVEGDTSSICIDTGYGAGNLRRYCQSLTSKPVRYVINTHSHFDHTAGDAYFDCAFMYTKAVPLATRPYASFKGIWVPRYYPVVTVDDGYVFHLGGRDLEVLVIPNHTNDGIALLDRSHRILFSGDEILSDHLAKLNVSVAQYAANMQKLVNVIDDYNLILGGAVRFTDVSCVKRLLACAQHILEGGADEPDTVTKYNYVKHQPAVPEGAEAVFVRHSPREGDSAGPEAPASEYTQMTYQGVTMMYLKDKIK
jgi:glyoxylase-like metal-dependent hydrolase (beta-lactamase superfamily II)